jgi:S1-C subfamily serine protease
MEKKPLVLMLVFMVMLNSCVTFFMPSKQKVTINTYNPKSKVYIDNEEVGDGSTIVTKVQKNGIHQVVVQTPDYKDAYYSLLPVRRQPGFWPMIILDIPFLYGLGIDPGIPKGFAYESSHDMTTVHKNVYRTPDQKYIDLLAIKLNIQNKEKDLIDYSVNYSSNGLNEKFIQAEKDKAEKDKKQELKDQKKKKKKRATLENEDTQIKYDDTKFSDLVYKTLKKTGYADTVHNILSGHNNYTGLEGSILKVSAFHVIGKQYKQYQRAKLYMVWCVKNSYGEVLDSIKTEDMSGEFYIPYSNSGESQASYKMFADAVDVSYMNLIKKPEFVKYLKIDTNYRITDPMLTIMQPKKCVTEVSDASEASVIVKRKDGGHGSGFAISNDGYILTNFHVIAGKEFGKFEELKVITASGEEVTATVVRYNRMRDIALLKVNMTFEKSFKLNRTKSFKNLMDVYTVGAPKSIDLGQSVSSGLISNERKSANVNLVQVSMSVNPGNSGGPLFDKTGNLHGVVTSKLVGYATEGVGFAIPSYLIANYLNLSLKD